MMWKTFFHTMENPHGASKPPEGAGQLPMRVNASV